MAGTFVATNDVATTSAGTTQTISVTYSAGQSAFVHLSWGASSGTATVSDPTNGSYAAVGTAITDVGGPDTYALFYLPSAAAGTVTITATTSGSFSFRRLAVIRFTGLTGSVQANNRQVQTSVAITADAVTSGTATPISQPAMVFGVSSDPFGTGLSAGTGFTDDGVETNANSTFGLTTRIENKSVSTLTAVAATFTSASTSNRPTSFVAIVAEVLAGPTINTSPVSVVIKAADVATFTVSATTSGGALSYQWKKNGSNVGTNSASYSVQGFIADNGAQITVDVTDSNGTNTSTAATLGVVQRIYRSIKRRKGSVFDYSAAGWFDASLVSGAGLFDRDMITLSVSGSHSTSGALSAAAATVAGTATHLALHTTTGALAASSASIAGTAAHQHTTTGALAASAASLAGTAAHLTLHATSGALSAAAATMAGTAVRPHATTGALVVGSAVIAGTALHPHATSGALVAQAAQVAGTALHPHTTSGALVVGSASVSGSADHATAGAGHSASGALAASAATASGTATHLTLHATSGALAASAATVAGTAAHQHTATGALVGSAATVSGTAAHLTLHPSTGALVASAATLSAAASRFITHVTTGAMQADAAALAGTATHASAGAHPTSAALISDSATMAGAAILISSRDTHDGAWHGYGKKKKRYVVRRGDELLEFATKAAAVNALKAKAKPIDSVPIAEIKSYAAKIGAQVELERALAQNEYELALELRSRAIDEEEIELLLLHL